MKVVSYYLLGLLVGGGAGVLLACVLLTARGTPVVPTDSVIRWFCLGGSLLGIPLGGAGLVRDLRRVTPVSTQLPAEAPRAKPAPLRRYGASAVTVLLAVAVIVFAFGLGGRDPDAPAPLESKAGDGEQIVLGFDGPPKGNIPTPWIEMKNVLAPGKPHFEFTERREKVAYLKCDNSSFSLNRLVDIDVVKFQQLNWEWRVEQLPTGADVHPKGKDDKVLQILLYFDGGNVIKYMWDTTAPIGTEFDEPPPPRALVRLLRPVLGVVADVKAIKEVVVESGRTRVGFWVSANRNVYDDYKRIYQTEPPLLKAIRIQSNSQFTASTGAGFVSQMVFGGSKR